MTSYTSQYPAAYSDTYVIATSKYNVAQSAYKAADPSLAPYTGVNTSVEWFADGTTGSTNQRFQIDLGSAKIIRRIYYENTHYQGMFTNYGVKTFTIYGSNTAGDFADVTWASTGDWVAVTPSQYTFDEHSGVDAGDPKYITISNSVAYQYYSIKFADSYGGGSYMALRHIEFQTEDGYTPTTGVNQSGVSMGSTNMMSCGC